MSWDNKGTGKERRDLLIVRGAQVGNGASQRRAQWRERPTTWGSGRSEERQGLHVGFYSQTAGAY